MCFASLYPLILYDKWHFTHTVSYKIKLSYESIVKESLEEGSTFFVNEGNYLVIFSHVTKKYLSQ
jgi:hypothetical protein